MWFRDASIHKVSRLLARSEFETLVTARSTKPGPMARNNSTPLRVLVAEDNPVNQRLITRLLEKHDHLVVIAENGLQALRALERAEQQGQAFDLVFMDVQMPILDGIDTTARIRAKEVTREPISCDCTYGACNVRR